MIEFLLEIPLNKKIPELTGLFVKTPLIRLHFVYENLEFIAWGDPICRYQFKERFQKNPEPEFILNNLYGHYYYIILYKNRGEIKIGNSLFGILPIYYYQSNGKIIFSENALSLGRYSGFKKLSSRFLLETILFNYPLFNHSIYDDIFLLPSNSYFQISGLATKIIKQIKIEDYFSGSPKSWRRSIKEIQDIFLEKVKTYLPEEHYVQALTGGFDGRTLASAGIFNNKNFSCYCFGSSESKDSQIALMLTGKSGLPFINIELDDYYIKGNSLKSGQEFIKNSSGTATFARAHYLFAVKQISIGNDYLITGNFGSEIFRSINVTGSVISENIVALFKYLNPKKGLKAIEKSKEFMSLNRIEFKDSWESLKEDILKLPCYDKDYSNLSQNQKFYVFVFEEVFRKYFGAEMVNQFKYIKNRTPFLDIDFLKATFKTELSGIHSDFFESNPFKRFKGQIAYAHIIRKAYPEFLYIITDKGYYPCDLLSFAGKTNILRSYLKKKTTRTSSDSDPFSVISSWTMNKDFWLKSSVSEDFFDLNKCSSFKNDEILFKIYSLSYLIGNFNS